MSTPTFLISTSGPSPTNSGGTGPAPPSSIGYASSNVSGTSSPRMSLHTREATSSTLPYGVLAPFRRSLHNDARSPSLRLVGDTANSGLPTLGQYQKQQHQRNRYQNYRKHNLPVAACIVSPISRHILELEERRIATRFIWLKVSLIEFVVTGL
ncbi:unnamed protein product [Protopolystoma xenopodis]|uniref:Uncharacterized protein n=1 Tax=Protopolystoma xenopodis TaxID=117903 RepID=A0A3S5CIX2_9PLAT|nr:unnamed protein product [Protopolystoma xenopodis]